MKLKTKLKTLTDEKIDKAMEYAIDWAQDYTTRNGKADSIPERQVAIAQKKQTVRDIVKWGDEKCPHIVDLGEVGTMELPKRACVKCWHKLQQQGEE